jgi:hypothetical protein
MSAMESGKNKPIIAKVKKEKEKPKPRKFSTLFPINQLR